MVAHDKVTGVPLCVHNDDAEACQLAHPTPAPDVTKEDARGYMCDGCGDQADYWDEDGAPRCNRCKAFDAGQALPDARPYPSSTAEEATR